MRTTGSSPRRAASYAVLRPIRRRRAASAIVRTSGGSSGRVGTARFLKQLASLFGRLAERAGELSELGIVWHEPARFDLADCRRGHPSPAGQLAPAPPFRLS